MYHHQQLFNEICQKLPGDTRQEFVAFANDTAVGKIEKPDMTELTVSGRRWVTDVCVDRYTPDEIPLRTLSKMRRHGQINLGLQIIKLPILGQKWWVEGEDTDICDYVQNIILKPIWRQLLRNTLSGVDWGVSINEKVWELKDGHWVYKKIKGLNPEDVELLLNDEGKFDGFRWEHRVHVPAEKTYLYVHDMDVTGNLWGRSRLSYAYEPWYWVTVLYQFYMRYLERRGIPPIKGRAPNEARKKSDGTWVECIPLLRNIAMKLANDSVAIVPAEYNSKGNMLWDLEYMETSEKGEQFMVPIEHLLATILRYLLVPERIFTQSSTNTGSYKMSDTHADVFWRMESGLEEECLEYINKYIIPQPVILEFGEIAPLPEVKMEKIQQENKDIISDIVRSVITETVKADGLKGLPIDIGKALEQLNIPLLAEDKREDMAEKAVIEVKGAGKVTDIADRKAGKASDRTDKAAGKVAAEAAAVAGKVAAGAAVVAGKAADEAAVAGKVAAEAAAVAGKVAAEAAAVAGKVAAEAAAVVAGKSADEAADKTAAGAVAHLEKGGAETDLGLPMLPKDISKKIIAHFEATNKYFQEAESVLEEKLGAIVDKMRDEVIARLTSKFAETRKAGEFREIDIKYKGEYQTALKKAIDAAYLYGLTSAKKEIGIVDWVPASADDKQYSLLRAEAISSKHFSDIAYMIKMVIILGLRGNKTDSDILYSVGEEMERFKNRLPVTARTEIVTAVNIGRNLVATQFA